MGAGSTLVRYAMASGAASTNSEVPTAGFWAMSQACVEQSFCTAWPGMSQMLLSCCFLPLCLWCIGQYMLLQQAGKFEAENDSASAGILDRSSVESERIAKNLLNIFGNSVQSPAAIPYIRLYLEYALSPEETTPKISEHGINLPGTTG
jgi:hypothetical protein